MVDQLLHVSVIHLLKEERNCNQLVSFFLLDFFSDARLFWDSVWSIELVTKRRFSLAGFLVHSIGPPTSALALALAASLRSSSVANLCTESWNTCPLLD